MPFVSAYDGCWECDAALVVVNQRDVTRKKFCSHGCRQKWRYKNEDWDWMARMIEASQTPAANAKKRFRASRVCEHCEAEYTATGARQRWCTTCVPDLAARGRMQRYGVGQAQYDEMWEAQGGLCAICRGREPQAVDHNHETGAVRGLLCHGCNGRLSVVDDPDWLRSAQDYVEGRFALC